MGITADSIFLAFSAAVALRSFPFRWDALKKFAPHGLFEMRKVGIVEKNPRFTKSLQLQLYWIVSRDMQNICRTARFTN